MRDYRAANASLCVAGFCEALAEQNSEAESMSGNTSLFCSCCLSERSAYPRTACLPSTQASWGFLLRALDGCFLVYTIGGRRRGPSLFFPYASGILTGWHLSASGTTAHYASYNLGVFISICKTPVPLN